MTHPPLTHTPLLTWAETLAFIEAIGLARRQLDNAIRNGHLARVSVPGCKRHRYLRAQVLQVFWEPVANAYATAKSR